MTKITQFFSSRIFSGKLLLLACVALSLSGCKKDDDTAELPDLLTIARTQANLEFFVAAVEYAGLDDTLASLEGITVFAPGNDAMSDAFNINTAAEFASGGAGPVEYVRDNLLQHIINQSRTYDELADAIDAGEGLAEYESLLDIDFGPLKTTEIQPVYAYYSNDYIEIGTSNNRKAKTANSAKVMADIEFNDGVGKNGVLHILDNFLYGAAYNFSNEF
jgi:uncharacterized surface protein with fasciclin (FAS1) repeats